MIWKLCVVLAAVAALAMPSTAAAGRTLDVDPHQVKFGKQPWNSFTKRTITITNVGRDTVTVAVEAGFVPDDFSPGQPESTCPLTSPTTLAPGDSCTHVIGFRPTPFFAGLETATVVLTARGPSGSVWEQRTVTITGRGV